MNKLIQSLAEMAKVKDVEAFAKALQSETDTDYKLDLGGLVIRTKDEEEQIRENLLSEAKTKNFTDAMEIQIRNMKKDLGLEFEGKRQEDFIKGFREQVLSEAKVEPNKKIEELTSSLEALRGQVSEKESAYAQLQSSVENDKRKYKAQSLIPNLPEGLGLDKDEATSLYFMTHEIKEDGVYRNGEKLKDKLEKPLSFEDSVVSFVESKGWNKAPAPKGRGGGAQGEGGSALPTSMDEYESYIKDKGWNAGSQEANALLSEVVKAKQ